MTVSTLAGGRYALGRRVGAGGMAEVYLGRDTRLERDVAIKVFRPGTADGIERGSVEARLLAGLDHPGLVRVLDMDTEHASGDGAYLVMEYIPGPDLGVVLRTGPLTPDGARHAGLDLSRALHHIHQRGVIHRDIKPSNILTRDAEPGSGVFTYLLTDFGIARFFDGSGMTATGQVIGSAAYFSPEQARGEKVGTPTDIYSLGLVLIECLTGERAFPGTGVESALARLHRSPSIPACAGAAMGELLAAMTLDDPGARPDARAVATALAELDGGAPGAAVHAAPAPLEPTQAMRAADGPAPGPGAAPGAAAGSPVARVDVPTAAVPVAAAPTVALPAAPVAAAPLTATPTAAAPLASAPAAVASAAAAAPARTIPVGAAPAAPPAGGGPGRGPDTAEFPGPVGASPVVDPDRPTPSGGDRGTRRRRVPGWLIVGTLVLAALAVVAAVLLNRPAGSGVDPEPLPSVPGTTGERLEELYESVNP
ncbi:serine/threonine protein kinase [Arthrobacter crusticola]|uniref:non-specific serine/threonine protein kinase n=1 Tax=Arthrobacter crusticola TaxID=2547960 RepID=A0A4R5TZW8_9MICC|nr:serine/threonine-protein kinase [Arthrobacter crusticola]TDK26849.1 serine/threonine protein kinase [Arthrobacter crusticola]